MMLFFNSRFFFTCNVDPRTLHSFPTRRSSDLRPAARGIHPRPWLDGRSRRTWQRRIGRNRGTPCRERSDGPSLIDGGDRADRKSTRLNTSHGYISYAVFCLKNKIQKVKAFVHL